MQINEIKESKILIQNWIRANKPLPQQSKAIEEAFLNQSKFIGSDAFILKMKKVIHKTSTLASGMTILQRLIDTNKTIEVLENPMKSCHGETVEFDFMQNQGYYSTLNEQGELELRKTSSTAIFIHEGLHYWHHYADLKNMTIRSTNYSVAKDMDNQEEEFTITGNLHLAHHQTPHKDFCCENTALEELGKDFKVNHKGVILPKGTVPSLKNMIAASAFGNIKKVLLGQINLQNADEKDTILEFALFKYFIELDPSKHQDWLNIIELLIKSGYQSEKALQLAVLGDLENTIKGLMGAGVKPPEGTLGMAVVPLSGSKLLKFLEKLHYVEISSSTDEYPQGLMTAERMFHERQMKLEYERQILSISCRNRKAPSREMIQNLLKAGAIPTETDFMEVLRRAFQEEYFEVLKLFLEKTTPSDAVIQYAIERDSLEAMSLFFKFGIQPQSWMLNSVLRYGERLSKIPELLLSKGLKPMERDLKLAEKRGRYDLAKIFSEKGPLANDENVITYISSIQNRTEQLKQLIR